ncbi:hypothetical protein GCM10023319_64070 [Nocardia iowensis]
MCATACGLILAIESGHVPAQAQSTSQSCKDQGKAIKEALPEDLQSAVDEIENAKDGKAVARGMDKLLTGVGNLEEGAETVIGFNLYASKDAFSPSIQESMDTLAKKAASKEEITDKEAVSLISAVLVSLMECAITACHNKVRRRAPRGWVG